MCTKADQKKTSLTGQHLQSTMLTFPQCADPRHEQQAAHRQGAHPGRTCTRQKQSIWQLACLVTPTSWPTQQRFSHQFLWLTAQIHGTRNKRNIAKALILALEGQQTAQDVYEAKAAQLAAVEERLAEVASKDIPELVARSGKLMIGTTLGQHASARKAASL